jgi:GWxTD domain-containing protein
MKRFLLILPLFLVFFTGMSAANLQARLATATFFAPGSGPYIETYLNINGHSTLYSKLPSGMYQSAVEINMVFRKDGKIAHFDKYKLLSPEVKDTVNDIYHFTDVQRIPLENGTYTMELVIRDFNDAAAKPYLVKQEVTLNYQPNVIAVSDVEFLQKFTPSSTESKLNRNGFELIPLVDNFFPPETNKMAFFAEVYNTSSIMGQDPYILAYHIETFEQKKVMNEFSRNLRQTSKPVNVLLTEIDIAELPSGNYNLVIEVRNKQNELLAIRETFFQRSRIPAMAESGIPGDYRNMQVSGTFVGMYTSRDTMAEYIRCLWPISSPNENTFAVNQLELADLQLMQQFFYDFWLRRNNKDPYKAWNDYHKEVRKVNQKYGAYKKKGYMTERGRVYLQHGPPDQLTEVYNEPSSYPYEIWQYYKMEKLDQTNRKFVFYNPELATNDFRLLHSDARGEINDPQWQIMLKRRSENMNDFDRTSPRQGFGTNTNQLYTNPR